MRDEQGGGAGAAALGFDPRCPATAAALASRLSPGGRQSALQLLPLPPLPGCPGAGGCVPRGQRGSWRSDSFILRPAVLRRREGRVGAAANEERGASRAPLCSAAAGRGKGLRERDRAPPSTPRRAAPPACCQPGNGSVDSLWENESIVPSLLFLLCFARLPVLGGEKFKRQIPMWSAVHVASCGVCTSKRFFYIVFFPSPSVSAGKQQRCCF